MKCIDIYNHFRKHGHWVNWNNTTDNFKAGNPEREVNSVAVAWKASWDALKKAYEQGAELLISHESICVNAVNSSIEPDVVFALPSEKPKFEWLEKTGLTVYRCHDFWDNFPEIGIRWAWQKGLNLGGDIIGDHYPLLITRIEPRSVGNLAKHVLERVRPLGQNGVLVTGDMDRMVSKVATGTGVTVNPARMVELGADVGILTDDYYIHVRMGTHAKELHFPTIVVNHGVSEEWGIKNLAAYVAQAFPELSVLHIPQHCPYTVVA